MCYCVITSACSHWMQFILPKILQKRLESLKWRIAFFVGLASQTSGIQRGYWLRSGVSCCGSLFRGPQPIGSCAIWVFEAAYPASSRCWMSNRGGSGCSSPRSTPSGLRKTGERCFPIRASLSSTLVTKVLGGVTSIEQANEQHHPSCLKRAVRYPAYLLVWGCVSARGVGKSCFTIPGKIVNAAASQP